MSESPPPVVRRFIETIERVYRRSLTAWFRPQIDMNVEFFSNLETKQHHSTINIKCKPRSCELSFWVGWAPPEIIRDFREYAQKVPSPTRCEVVHRSDSPLLLLHSMHS